MFPTLALKLTEITLGGSFRGVKLDSPVFDEPLQRRAMNPADGGRREHLRRRSVAKRNERFCSVLDAVDRVLSWGKI